MAQDAGKFIIDKEELKPGLIIFRRSDVRHRKWYCRVKVPNIDRYKTVSLKTEDVNTARTLAWDEDGNVRYAIRHDVPVFNRPFRDVAREYLTTQVARARRGEISKARPEKMKAIVEGALEAYIGSTQVHRIGDELWGGYPAWRRDNGEGRVERNGSRMVPLELATALVEQEQAMRERMQTARGLRPKAPTPDQFQKAVQEKMAKPVPFVSDATIRLEMSIFGAVMNYAIKKRYAPASTRFDERPKLKIVRREEFTLEEYRSLHTKGRKWIKETYKKDDKERKHPIPTKAAARWYRDVTYNMILVACNTGMRPSEMKNLRWRDISPAKDKDGRDILVMFVQGKKKSRKLVAPASVGKYLERIRAKAIEAHCKRAGVDQPDDTHAPRPDDAVFTTITGEPASTLYKHLVDDLLESTGLHKGADGTIRTTYSFRHTYATMRLAAGVDVYFLAEQMGTSVKMIEDHYGHVNTIKHADRVLTGIGGWETMHAELDAEGDVEDSTAKARQAVKAKQPANPGRSKR